MSITTVIGTQHYKIIENARENLQDHLENDDLQVADPLLVHTLAQAYLQPCTEPTATFRVDDCDDLGNKHQRNKFLYSVVCREVHLELEHEYKPSETLRLAHIVVSKHQRRLLMPAKQNLGFLAFRRAPMSPEDESIVIEYSHSRKRSCLGELDDLTIAERLLEMPRNPTYVNP